MAPNSPECSFIHASMAGSRSTAPLNRSSSVLIVAPLSRSVVTLHLTRVGHWLVVPAGTKEIYFLSNAVALTDSERLVGKPLSWDYFRLARKSEADCKQPSDFATTSSRNRTIGGTSRLSVNH